MSKQTANTKLREEAKLVMWKYYQENKSTLPKWIKEFREAILSELVSGIAVETVFERITKSVE